MRTKLTLFVLTLLVACLPAAAGETAPAAEAAPPEVAAPAAEAPAPAEVTLEELFESLSPTAGAEEKYICPTPGDCTNSRDCWAHQSPRNCGDHWSAYACSNPSGQVCQGLCFCA